MRSKIQISPSPPNKTPPVRVVFLFGGISKAKDLNDRAARRGLGAEARPVGDEATAPREKTRSLGRAP